MAIPWGPNNPFFQGLERDDAGRQMNFASRLSSGLPLGQLNFAQSLYNPVFGRFQGEVGRGIRGTGVDSSLSFDDFLNQFNLGRMIKREQPQQNRFLSSSTDFRY